MKNKAHVEGLICESYIVEEMSFFANQSFEKDVPPYKRMRVGRNEECVNKNIPPCSIFNYLGQGHDRMVEEWLSQEKLHAGHTYILGNCEEAQLIYQYV